MSQAKDLAREWIEVWGRDDPATLPLADGFVHVSPFGTIEGREKYLEVIRPLASDNVSSLRIRDILGEGDRACITFEMDTPNGPVDCCDWVTVAGGQITSVHAYYDPRKLPSFEEY